MRTKSTITFLLITLLAVSLMGCDGATETAVTTARNDVAATGDLSNAGQADAPVGDALPTIAPSRGQNGNTNGNANSAGNGNATMAASRIHTRPFTGTLPISGELSAGDVDALRFMREEEKMARDVYNVLYQTWGLPVFQNVAASEQAHMDAILSLLNAYGLDDPAAGKGPGEFTNPDLQALHDELVAQGSRSLADALLAGGAIEEIDILDLEARLAETENPHMIQMFNHLRNGSENHLRAFVNNYERQAGLTYGPQYMTQARYQTAMAAMGSGGNGAQNGLGAQNQNAQGNQNQGQGGQGQGQNGAGNGNGYRGGRNN